MSVIVSADRSEVKPNKNTAKTEEAVKKPVKARKKGE